MITGGDGGSPKKERGVNPSYPKRGFNRLGARQGGTRQFVNRCDAREALFEEIGERRNFVGRMKRTNGNPVSVVKGLARTVKPADGENWGDIGESGQRETRLLEKKKHRERRQGIGKR